MQGQAVTGILTKRALNTHRSLWKILPARAKPTGGIRSLQSSSSLFKTTQWYYAVRKGYEPGVYGNWEDAKKQVQGYSGSDFQKFSSERAADAFMNGARLEGEVSGPDRIVVYVDGSRNEAGKSGFGAYWAADQTTSDLCERVPAFGPSDDPSLLWSDKCELYGALRVLEVDPDPSRELHVYCDSKYVVDTFTGDTDKPKVRRSNIKNYDIIKLVDELRARRSKAVQFVWIEGHAKLYGNVEAHDLASEATDLPDVPSRDIKAELANLKSQTPDRVESHSKKRKARGTTKK